MPTSSVNGIQVYWEINGDVGDTVVLVHGSWGDHENWASVVPALSRRFRVLIYDRSAPFFPPVVHRVALAMPKASTQTFAGAGMFLI